MYNLRFALDSPHNRSRRTAHGDDDNLWFVTCPDPCHDLYAASVDWSHRNMQYRCIGVSFNHHCNNIFRMILRWELVPLHKHNCMSDHIHILSHVNLTDFLLRLWGYTCTRHPATELYLVVRSVDKRSVRV